jgi:RNA-directed DNA polymerase
VIIVRFADDVVAGFEHESDARRFLADLRQRMAKFGLELHPDKTRLIEFGRFAARDRKARRLGKPETFDFLGFTHRCGKTKAGRFWLTRKTISKRMRAKLAEVKDQCLRRRHQPIPLQGQWLASVVRGHLAYYAVPGNFWAVAAFRHQALRHWFKALRRRSQRTRLSAGQRFSGRRSRRLRPRSQSTARTTINPAVSPAALAPPRRMPAKNVGPDAKPIV